MSTATSIEWTDTTWNPVRGCSLVSPGCKNCYAMRQAHRFAGSGQPYEGLVELGRHGPRWTGEVRFIAKALPEPYTWRAPRRVFVNSMSDLFHERVSLLEIAAVFGVMALACHHTYQVLTKRPARMRDVLRRLSLDACWEALDRLSVPMPTRAQRRAAGAGLPEGSPLRSDGEGALWPLPNVWLGVSCENQATADHRSPLLLQTPAAVRFLSCEPLLGRIDLIAHLTADIRPAGAVARPPGIDWVIIGGESGSGARPCDVDWIRSIVGQCQSTDVAAFVKQLGSKPYDGEYTGKVEWDSVGGTRFVGDAKGGDLTFFPPDLRVREFPTVRP